MKKLSIVILLTYILGCNKILSCCGPRHIDEDDFLNIENGNVLKILRNVCQVHENVKDEDLKKEYNFILDQIINNGNNKKPEKNDTIYKHERFVSFLYKFTIFYKLSNDKKSLVPVKCAHLPYISSGKFYSHDYELFKLDYKSIGLFQKNQSTFKEDVEKDIYNTFEDYQFIKMEEIAKVFEKYNPDYFYIIVSNPDYADYTDENKKPINYGFIFERLIKHSNVFSNEIRFKEKNKSCC